MLCMPMSSRHSLRQARLRPEFAELYPPLEPGEWIPAAVASARMLLWQTRQPGASRLAQRTLDPQHFDFRGGPADAETRVHGTRFADHETGTPLRREARLRPGFAQLYPALPADTWMGAAELGALLLRWIVGGGSAPLGSRLLSDEHFEFRGGDLPRGSIGSPRTRHNDRMTQGEVAAG